MSRKKFICPVCGYDSLDEPAYDEYDCPTYNICPCCLNEFGYTDARRTHEELRKEWICKGKKWGRLGDVPPIDWDANIQLKNVLTE